MRYFIKCAYNGTAYHGWQIQPNATSVQEVLTRCLSLVLRENIEITGCGRTDTGVHASCYYAHFDCQTSFSKIQLFQLTRKLNSFLPDDIALFDIMPVADQAHARFDAVSRTYKYYINQKKNPFLQGQSWHLAQEVDVELMNKAAQILLTHDDFACFAKAHTDVKTTFCKLSKAEWAYDEQGSLVFTISADRFLRNMVRAIVGTLVEIGMGKTPIDELAAILESKNRSKAGYSVPAHGLFLWDIRYPEELFEKDV